ncbi:unnamed protein product [Pleuronectes platessa]|uniref:Uncharacterized protein n=1 Tax=Pleuronectes platessa TaxID=8262 RepID=A0A9N7ULG3_PLEPL|nr:unnamed protein product [Pleuronectes platessa]
MFGVDLARTPTVMAQCRLMNMEVGGRENKLKWSRKWQRWGDSNYEWQPNTFAACVDLPMLNMGSRVKPVPSELAGHYLTASTWLSQVLSKLNLVLLRSLCS